MSNKQFYKETFEHIQMSPESKRKVKNMNEISKKRKLRRGLRVAIAAAALIAVFGISNAAVYAATGDTLVEKVEKKISVYINGKKADCSRIEKQKDKDGNDCYVFKLDESKDKKAEIRLEE